MLKQIKDKKKIKISLKDALKDFAKLVGITIIALAISYVIVKVCGNILDKTSKVL